jgi:hypothetical protein
MQPFADTFKSFHDLLMRTIRCQAEEETEPDIARADDLANRFNEVAARGGFNNRQRMLAVVLFMIMALDDREKHADGKRLVQ